MKNCGHYVKACVPDCDECVVDAMLNRCTKHARRDWLKQIHDQDKSRYTRIVEMMRKQGGEK